MVRVQDEGGSLFKGEELMAAAEDAAPPVESDGADGTGTVSELLLGIGLPETIAKTFAREKIDCETLVLLNEARALPLIFSPSLIKTTCAPLPAHRLI